MLLGHHDILSCGWSVVMMEFLPKPEWVSGLEIVEEVDLSVRLVDFDWAGEINKAKYPFPVNPDLGHGFKRPSVSKEEVLLLQSMILLWCS